MRILRNPLMRLVLAAGVGVIVAGARADIIELKDGRQFNGTFDRQGNSLIIKTTDGTTVTVVPSDLARVTLVSNTTPADAAASEWLRVSADVKSSNDLPTIVALHQKFLAKYPDQPISADVRSALAVYQALAKSDPVKFRGKWVARAQIDVMTRQWTDDARPALEQYRAGHYKETLDAARKALAADEQNPDAMALAGLAAFRQKDLPLAHSYFTSLAASDPSSVLAENNLGVIQFQLKQPIDAMTHYTRALQAKFDSRLVLDNVAEVLNSPAVDRDSAAYKALQYQFVINEPKMESDLAGKGWTRIGATWVAADQAGLVQKSQQDFSDRLTRADAQFQVNKTTLGQLGDQIAKAASDVDSYANYVSFYVTQIAVQSQALQDVTLLTNQRDLSAQSYARARLRLDSMRRQYDQLARQVADFGGKIDKIKATWDTNFSGYSGVQRIMEPGEADNPPSPAAVNTPTTLPSFPEMPAVQVIIPPAPPPAPMLVPIPIPQPVLVIPGGLPVIRPDGSGRGHGGGGGGHGADTMPATMPGGASAASGGGALSAGTQPRS